MQLIGDKHSELTRHTHTCILMGQPREPSFLKIEEVGGGSACQCQEALSRSFFYRACDGYCHDEVDHRGTLIAKLKEELRVSAPQRF